MESNARSTPSDQDLSERLDDPVKVPPKVEKPVPQQEPEVPQPKVDFDDPAERFRLVSLAITPGVAKRATIEDLKVNLRRRLKEGDVFSEYKLVRIDAELKLVELRGPDKKLTTVYLK